MICVDNNFLVLLIEPELNPPVDPNTGAPTERVPERIKLLQETWEKDNEVILIPDPALAEFLMLADEEADRLSHLQSFQTTQNFEIKPFDTTVAIELAAMYIREKRGMSNNKRKEFKALGTKTHMSFDRQIVAIAKFHKVSAIYSDDKGVKTFGDIHGVPVIRTFDLPLPPDPEPVPEPEPDPQGDLFAGQQPGSTVTVEELGNEGKADNVVSIDFRGSDGGDAPIETADGNAPSPRTTPTETEEV